MKFVIRTIKIIDKISETVGKSISFLILFMVFIDFTEVVLRYFFGHPTAWSWEVATYLYGANFVLAGGWALKEGKHVRTDILYDKLSQRWRAIFDLFTFSTIFLLFCGVLTFLTVKAAIFSVSIVEYSYTMNRIPIFPLKVAIAVGFSLLLLQGVAKIARDIIFLAKGEVV